jgi:hypothetical protein
MNGSNKKNLLETFEVLLPCPNCHNPPTTPSLRSTIHWTKSEIKKRFMSDQTWKQHQIYHNIKYGYCSHCILTPEQVTQVKAFFNE